jgi:hypothetical protein
MLGLMDDADSALRDWTPEQLALGRHWVETWRLAGADLERIRHAEIRCLDGYRAIERLCRSADDKLLPQSQRSG